MIPIPAQALLCTAGSAHEASALSPFLFTGRDLALGDKFLFDECTLWECFILTDYFYLFNVIFKYLFFILKEYHFLRRKNELIKNPLLSSLLECFDMGGAACWDLAGQRTEGVEDEVSPTGPASAGVGGRVLPQE